MLLWQRRCAALERWSDSCENRRHSFLHYGLFFPPLLLAPQFFFRIFTSMLSLRYFLSFVSLVSVSPCARQDRTPFFSLPMFLGEIRSTQWMPKKKYIKKVWQCLINHVNPLDSIDLRDLKYCLLEHSVHYWISDSRGGLKLSPLNKKVSRQKLYINVPWIPNGKLRDITIKLQKSFANKDKVTKPSVNQPWSCYRKHYSTCPESTSNQELDVSSLSHNLIEGILRKNKLI